MTRATFDRRPTAAFSLIEAVIAIAIAGIAFFVLTETFFNILLTLERLQSESDFQKDVRFVRGQVIRLADRAAVEAGGDIITLDSGRADWSATVEDTEVADLFRVRLEIEFTGADGQRVAHGETLYLLRPTWSDPIERSALITEARQRIEREALHRDW